jgi:hypothetical protein
MMIVKAEGTARLATIADLAVRARAETAGPIAGREGSPSEIAPWS